MPHIIISAAQGADGSDVVVYREDVTPLHMDTEHSARQLIERVRWAVQDAEEIERRPPRRTRRRH